MGGAWRWVGWARQHYHQTRHFFNMAAAGSSDSAETCIKLQLDVQSQSFIGDSWHGDINFATRSSGAAAAAVFAEEANAARSFFHCIFQRRRRRAACQEARSRNGRKRCLTAATAAN